MANVELVIKIPEDSYKATCKGSMLPLDVENVVHWIKNGILLPKEHGDLKNMSNLQYVFDLTREDPIYSGKDIERAIKSMKSIIKADKTESER